MAAVRARQISSASSARPRAAEPLLASSFLSSSSWDSILDTLEIDDGTIPQPHVLKTHISSLDAALASTFKSGSLVALSSELNSPRDAIAKSLLVDCLVSHTDSTVAVVDTTGNFDVVGLYKMILERLEEEPEKVLEMRESEGRGGAQEVAAKVLDRVEIMRVFDLVGMREAVGELRDGLERKAARGEYDGVLGEIEPASESPTAAEAVTEKTPSPQLKRTEIADSEDEDEGIEDLDDEMLFDTTAPAPDPVQDSSSAPAADATSLPTQASQQSTLKSPPLPTLKMILIDNLSHVLTPLLKQDTISANTLATTFLTTLQNLTRTHALHTILLNPCTIPRANSPSRKAVDTAPPGPQQAYRPQPPPPPSIFSSNVAVPALLGLMSRYADAHLLVSMLPRRKMDARAYYADTGGRERGKRKGVVMGGVVEVVADRWGGRVGAWGSFKEGKDGEIKGL